MINVAIWIFYVLVALFTAFGPITARGGESAENINRAIELQKNSEVKKHVQDKSFDPAKGDEDGITPLMAAAMNGNLQALKLILKLKPNLEQQNNLGDTALAMAVSNDQDAAAKLLIESGAKVDIPVLSENKDTLLITAAKSSEKTTQLILKKDKKTIDQKNALGNTALIESILAGYTDIATMLVKNGADVSVKNNDGKNALDLSKELKNQTLTSLLSKKSK
ncbi:ankyrin repeat domain-containing protein [Bdellovibrio sp. GT3]|uniref:ankyrin repeat domain-containing protein n=1 Tax=Bdellovibrio sp. GT3 TaxID=3136282 RepID=UPI0030F36DA9